MAVWALAQFGFRVLIAPSFGAIFRSNCLRNGLLPLVLPAAEVAHLSALAAAAPLKLAVDLLTCEVRSPDGSTLPFTIDEHEREMLLTGMDQIERTWQWRDEIQAFEAADHLRRPWIWR
jgi:3-isopropylmalate/(R)-2-methylmalate dehydratase small subunit